MFFGVTMPKLLLHQTSTMQSRLTSATKSHITNITFTKLHNNFPFSRLLFSSSLSSRTRDLDQHNAEDSSIAGSEAAMHHGNQENNLPSSKKNIEELKYPAKLTPVASSPSLESSPVQPLPYPVRQQKRHLSRDKDTENCSALDNVSCVGVDGSNIISLVDDNNRVKDKEFFDKHKPSMLENVEFADTRKPVSRATDSTFVEEDITGWSDVQLDSADGALLRAELIKREMVMRGDPDAPQSRALREALRARARVEEQSV